MVERDWTFVPMMKRGFSDKEMIAWLSCSMVLSVGKVVVKEVITVTVMLWSGFKV